MKKIMKSTKGITLISLVVTIIILLILAGISIGMLSGDNSIIGQAGNAKTQTDIAGEKEILQTASLAAISKEKYGELTKDKLDDELNNYSEIQNTEQTDNGIVVTFKSNRAYLVNSDGDVSSYSDIKIGNLVVKDGNTVLAENCKSVQLGKALTISFDASIANGQITSITPNIAYTTAGERSKTFTIIGKTSEGKEITKEYIVNLKGYYSIPEIQIGDFVQYDIEYQDMLNTSLNYSTTNGWRLLNCTKNDDGTYSNVELISTGVPAMLNYMALNSSTRINNDWWQTTNSELNSFRNLLTNNGTISYGFYTDNNNDYYALQASAGMYNNFGNIVFRYGTDSGNNYNQGYYNNIKKENSIYNSQQSEITVNGNDLFKIGNTKIRMLILPEVKNKISGDTIGIYKLSSVVNVLSWVNYGGGNGGNYWIASPRESAGNGAMIVYLSSDGTITSCNLGATAGVRPVITLLDDKVNFDISNDGKYFIIE